VILGILQKISPVFVKASTFINTLILSQHEGGQCLDDTTHIVNLCIILFVSVKLVGKHKRPKLVGKHEDLLLEVFFLALRSKKNEKNYFTD
jgi:hypothetical protein